MIHHIKRATRHLIFWSLIASAIGLTGVRLLMLGIDNYKAELSARVGKLVGAPVTIGRLRANMRGYNPELVLRDIKILPTDSQPGPGNGNPAIQLKEIRLGINLLDALVNTDRLASTWVTLVGAKLTVKRKQDGGIAIVGLKASDEQPLWLLQGSKYEVLQSEISWQDELNPKKSAVADEVDLAIMNDGSRHRVNIRVKLPPKYGDALRVSLDLTGNIFEPSAIDGAVFVEGKNLNLAEWTAGGLPLAMTLRSGVGDVRLWGGLQHSQLVSLAGDAQLQQLHPSRPEQGAFLVKQLETRFYWKLDDGRWRLDVPRFLLETADKKWPDAVFSVSGDHANDYSLHKLGLFVESVDLQEVSKILQFFAPLPKKTGALLAQAQLKGALEQFSVFADLDEKHFAVNGKFTHITVAPSAAVPGVENLDGQLKGSDQEGRVVLTARDARLTTVGLFRDALIIKKLDGTLNWRQTPGDWRLSSPMIALDSADLTSTSRLFLSIPKATGKVFMDLQIAFAGDDMSKTANYLPVGIMGKPIVEWLDHAFISGRIPKGGILFQGNLSDFPFTGGQGVFEAGFEVDGLELAYHPDWPRLTGLGGEVLFLRDSLRIDIQRGESRKVKINQARITIPQLNVSEHLLVQGQLETGLLPGLEFLRQTPLKAPVDKLLDAVTPQGNTEVTLDLKLPLAEGAPTFVDGSARLEDAKLKVKALDLEVSRITGALKFNGQGVYSDAIKAVALENPIQIAIKNSPLQKTSVNVTGHAGVGDLQKQFKLPGWQVAEGAADYQLALQLPYDERAPELVVRSKLAGVALALPGSLAKTREQQRPLSLTFDLADETLLPISLNYDNQLKAAIKFNVKEQRFESGTILAGAGTVAQSRDAGIKLAINHERLALQDWLGLASSLAQGKDGEAAAVMNNLREITLHSEHGLWKKADLGFIDLVLKPEGNYWSGTINSTIAKGELKIPVDLNGADSIVLTMNELELSVLKQLKYQGDALEPVSAPDFMPLLTITSQKTLWQSVDLGQLSLQTERIPNGITFKRLELTGNDLKLVLSGDWKVNGGKSETRLYGNLVMPQTGPILSKLGITKDLTETRAVIDFTGGWKAAPYQLSLKDLEGRIDVNLKGGRILSIEPGFGRILGILAMDQWIKRLQLDFSDVYEEGLTFNSINGRFDLLKGKAVTHNLIIDAIPAKITLTGETDFINRRLDQVANVTPKSADAVPIAGTIMGKVAALIGRSLTGKDQEGFFFGSQYLIKGDWGNAQIIPLHENEGLLQKTWTGITGFPWLRQPKNQ